MPEDRVFVDALERLGYRFYSGVPCSFFTNTLNYIISNNTTRYVAAPNEGSALAIASGSYLAGVKSVVVLQNSGIGNLINPLASLNMIYKIPVLIIVSGRGYKVDDEPQHAVMGKVMHDLFKTIGIGCRDLHAENHEAATMLNGIDREMQKTMMPYALIVPKGVMAGEKIKAKLNKPHLNECAVDYEEASLNLMKRYEAIKVISDYLTDEAVIASTGMISRELFTINDRPLNFYTFGSMGHVASIGLGLALNKPDKRMVVLDGDGSFLMHMGIASSIGHYKPKNVTHIVLDNEAYESTGNQATTSSVTDIADIARACNYTSIFKVYTKNGLAKALLSKFGSPRLIHIKINNEKMDGIPRITTKHTAEQVTRNFMEALK